MTDLISQAAIDLIVREEVSGKEVYERNYRRPRVAGRLFRRHDRHRL